MSTIAIIVAYLLLMFGKAVEWIVAVIGGVFG